MWSTIKHDLFGTIKLYRYVLYRAYVSQKLKVRRSAIGLFLEPVMLVISTYCITIVWTELFGKGGGREFTEFFLYVLSSFLIWNLISSNVSKLGASLLRRSKQVTNTRDPALLGILIDITDNFMTFLLSLPLVLLILLLLSDITILGVLIFLYGCLLIFLSAVGWGLLISISCLFFGDLRTIVSSVMKIGFLLTPVIWQLERLGEYQEYIYFNPFYNYLAICRGGLLDGAVGSLEILIATSTTFVMLLLGFIILGFCNTLFRRRVFSL